MFSFRISWFWNDITGCGCCLMGELMRKCTCRNLFWLLGYQTVDRSAQSIISTCWISALVQYGWFWFWEGTCPPHFSTYYNNKKQIHYSVLYWKKKVHNTGNNIFCGGSTDFIEPSHPKPLPWLLVIGILTLCNWHSNTSEMKYRHLTPMTVHNNVYTPHFAKHNNCWMCACEDEDREKEEEKQRGPYDLSISSVVGASVLLVCLQLLTPLSTQSLGLICVNFCVWLWARGMRVCVNRCVARLTVWKLIYTVSALTPALCVWDLCLHVLYTAHCTLFTTPPGHATCAQSAAFVSWSF